MPRTITTHQDGRNELWSWGHFSAVQRDEWNWPNFSASEMRCRKTGRLQICPSFMDKIQLVRKESGIPMLVTSGFRSPAYNASVSHTGSRDGPHVDSMAIDIAVSRSDAFELVKRFMNEGALGLGLKQHGDGRFLHIDFWSNRTSPAIWTYGEP